MPKTTENDSKLSMAFHHATDLRASKQLDYGSIHDYFPFGAKSYMHEIHKKTKRLINLANNGVAPTNESVRDNLLDLINYASYYYEWLNDKEDDI